MKLGVIVAKRFSRNRLALIGFCAVALLLFSALAAPVITPHSPTKIDVHNILSPPSMNHIFGTDELGRDVFSRMIFGSRVSLQVGFVAVGIAVIIGIIVGAIAGYYGGWMDSILMRFVDVMLAIPTLFLILAVIAVVEPSIIVIMVVIGVTSWMGISRLVRAEFLSLKERDFVLAAKSLGANDMRIIFKHILPNALAPVFVSAAFRIAGAILLESGLSFLGLGVQPPTPSWGNILTSGKDNITVAWWLSFYPGIAILIAALSYNLVGEGLRDALDPRLWDMEV
ncbi:MAG: ABC transporter permease [Nitrospiraceae bacterium]|nr:ABC transporter permease [Nitrospiraceae bacterium]